MIFDAHFHIIDPDFPLVSNQGFLPEPFLVSDYQSATHSLNAQGGAIVSGSFQAFDQTYLISALKILGAGFVGVANIPFDMPDTELEELNTHGIRAVRFNLKRGGSEKLAKMEYLSNKLFDQFGWHTELYVDSRDLNEIAGTLQNIPQYSIDHLGLSKQGIPDLLNTVENGAVIKATGFGRVDFDPIPLMKQIHSINPNAMIFGSDLPSTRAKTPFSAADVDLIRDNFSAEDQHMIFYENAMKWYRLDPN